MLSFIRTLIQKKIWPRLDYDGQVVFAVLASSGKQAVSRSTLTKRTGCAIGTTIRGTFALDLLGVIRVSRRLDEDGRSETNRYRIMTKPSAPCRHEALAQKVMDAPLKPKERATLLTLLALTDEDSLELSTDDLYREFPRTPTTTKRHFANLQDLGWIQIEPVESVKRSSPARCRVHFKNP